MNIDTPTLHNKFFRKYTGWLEKQLMDKVRNPNHKFMEHNLPIVIIKMLPIGVGVPDHIKVHYQFYTVFMQPHQEISYVKEIFQNMHWRFLDALDHLQNHWASVDGTETTTLRIPISQDYLKRSLLSGLGEIVIYNFGGGNSVKNSWATVEKINLPIL